MSSPLEVVPVDALKVALGVYSRDFAARRTETADDVELMGFIASACSMASELAGFPIPAADVTVGGRVNSRGDVELYARRVISIESADALPRDCPRIALIPPKLDASALVQDGGVAEVERPEGGWPIEPPHGARVRAQVRAGLADMPDWPGGDETPEAVLMHASFPIRNAVLMLARALFNGATVAPVEVVRVLSA